MQGIKADYSTKRIIFISFISVFIAVGFVGRITKNRIDYESVDTNIVSEVTSVKPSVEDSEREDFHKKRIAWNNRIDLFVANSEEVETKTLAETAKIYSHNRKNTIEIDQITSNVIETENKTLNTTEETNEVNLNEDIVEDIPTVHFNEADLDIHDGFIPVYNPTETEKQKIRQIVNQTYQVRRKLLREKCGNPSTFTWSDDMQLIAAPMHGVVVCVVQKAASTSWHKMIHRLSEPSLPWERADHIRNFNAFKKLSFKVKADLLTSANVTRVITVRHPLSRLISGWENKFLNENMKLNKAAMLRSMPKLKDFAKDYPDPFHYISFNGLIRYIVDHRMDEIDVHFHTIEKLCSPCKYAYDYIVKAETSPVESWFVLDRFNGSFSAFASHTPTTRLNDIEKPKATLQTDPIYFIKKISRYEALKMHEMFSVIDKNDIERLKQIYEHDFKMFGYTFNSNTLSAGGFS